MISISDQITLTEYNIITSELYNESNKFNNWPNTSLVNISNVIYLDFIKCFNKLIIKEENKVILVFSIEKLDWDSDYFGFNCARITNFIISDNIDKSLSENLNDLVLKFIDDFVTKNNIRFISADIDSWQNSTSQIIQNYGFRYILTWLDGFIPTKNLLQSIELPKGHSFGEVTQTDIEYFKYISNNQYFKGGRFYLDENISPAIAGQLYSTLIDYSFTNDDILIKYVINNNPVGIFICKKIVTYSLFNNLKVAALRFLLVDDKYRNLKIGKQLFNATLYYLKDKADIISTGLEIHNIKSLNLHSDLNFNFNYTHNAFHKWYN